MMTIENTSSIGKFLSTTKAVHVAAVCQRDVSWFDEQCRVLFKTVTEVIKDSNEHVIGTICIEDNSESGDYSLIDGQQPLISISLL